MFKAEHKITKIIYAVKEIEKKRIILGNMLKHVRLECKIMYKIHHKNIVTLYNHFETSKGVYLLLEYCEGG